MPEHQQQDNIIPINRAELSLSPTELLFTQDGHNSIELGIEVDISHFFQLLIYAIKVNNQRLV
jgi:hypothetical protein